MKNPRRPFDSPIRVEEGKTTDMRRCKAYKSSADYTYSKSDDYKQREALGLTKEVSPGRPIVQPPETIFTPDPKLMDAVNKDLRNRNIRKQ